MCYNKMQSFVAVQQTHSTGPNLFQLVAALLLHLMLVGADRVNFRLWTKKTPRRSSIRTKFIALPECPGTFKGNSWVKSRMTSPSSQWNNWFKICYWLLLSQLLLAKYKKFWPFSPMHLLLWYLSEMISLVNSSLLNNFPVQRQLI